MSHAAVSVEGLSSSPPIIPREKLDFGLSGDIPRYWFGGDPFKSRLFDALSTIFPEGERYFISCVRDYRDQIQDEKLLADIRDFMKQEGQHSKLHGDYNNRLKAQGMPVDEVDAYTRKVLFDVFRKRLPAWVTLAHTAALEHLTASLAGLLLSQPHEVRSMDPRMRALYVWHGMEEVEHKAVAFDVMQKVAGVGFVGRCLPFLFASVVFPLNTMMITMAMLKADGFSWWQRMKLLAGGAAWLYKPGGFLWAFWRPYLSYFKPGFHPWHDEQGQAYQVWVSAMNRTGDPLAASDAMLASLA